MKAGGQEVWSLQQCVEYALENNIQIRQQGLAVDYQQQQLDQAKATGCPI